MNKNFLAVFAIFVIVGCGLYVRKAVADENSFEKFRLNIATKEQLLSTLQLKFIVSSFSISGKEKSGQPTIGVYTWATDGIRWRSDQKSPIDNEETTMSSFNGEEYYDYKLEGGSAVVADEVNSDNVYTSHVDYLLLSWGQGNMSDLLAKLKLVSHERVKIRGEELDKYIAVNNRPAYVDYYNFLVEKNLNIVELQFVNDKKGSTSSRGYTYRVKTSQETNDGFTLPTSVQKGSLILSKNEKPALQWFQYFTAEEVTYNKNISDEVFDLPIALGTEMLYGDGITPSTLVTSEPTPAQDISSKFFLKAEQDKDKIVEEQAIRGVTPNFTFDPQVVPDFE